MSLQILPYELIGLILPYISLRDICRLNMAANSHYLYEKLLKAIHGLEYEIGSTYTLYTISDSLVDWLLKYEIKMKTLSINGLCFASALKYISTMGVNVTNICVGNISNMLKVVKYLPNVEVVTAYGFGHDPVAILKYFPKVTSISTSSHQTPTSNLNSLSPEQYLQIKEITLGTLSTKMIPYVKFFPRLEKLRLPDFSVDDVNAMTLSPSTCSNLTLLELSIMRDALGSLQFLLSTFPQLQHLDLNVKSQTCDVLYNPVHTVNNNLRVLKLTLSVYHDVMFHLLADCKLNNLQELQILSYCCNYSPSNRLSMIRFLSSCKELKLFTFIEIVKSETSCQLLYDVLYAKLPQLRHLDIQQGNRQSLMRQVNEPILTMPSLKSLWMRRCENETIPLLKYCPNLIHLKMHFTAETGVDSKLLYDCCPNLRSLTYEGMKGYELFKHSHEKLEKLKIIGPLHDSSNKKETIRCSCVEFPSLNELYIDGNNIDPRTWNRVLFSCRFNVSRFGLFRLEMLGDDKIAILDSLLHHSNFKSLQLVVCDLENCKRQELETMSGGRISFRCSQWIE